jgi:CRISPR-associated protein Csx17
MAGHILELRGCTPEPLGNYLKGLGVFRLIAEQADPRARTWWKNGVLWLQTKWSREELMSFFLRGIGENKTPVYSPTPIFAPWGGRPGFYQDGNDKAKQRLARLMQSGLPDRFDNARQVIKATRAVLDSRTATVRVKNKDVVKPWGELSKTQRAGIKNQIIAAMRNSWGGQAVDWIDACLSLEEDAKFGFLYGTGGNEGSADITNNFWELIEETIGIATPTADTSELLNATLFGDSRVGGTSKTAGQHFPLAAGSSNCGQEFFSSSSANPWDVLLMMEGAVLFAGATTKRLSQHGKGKAAFPFMIDHLSADEASASIKDEASQDIKVMRCRAEFWMPMWGQPTLLSGVQSLLAEGKLQRISGERTEHTLHALEAIKSLGVARGIDTFHRVALFERRGKGYYLASSLGYHSTAQAPDSLAPQLTEIEDFRQRVYSKLREGPGIPDRVMRARQSLHTALATLLTRDEQRSISVEEILVDVLTRVAGVEREVSFLKDREQLLNPCPPLSRAWMPDAANDSDFRLARAIAGIAAWGESSDPHRPTVEAVRSNLLPVRRRSRAWQWDETSRSAVWSRGTSLSANLVGVLRRRLIDAQRGKGNGLPLWSQHGATFSDLLAYWNGEFDEARVADLIHGLALIDSGQWDQDRVDDRQSRDETSDLRTSAVWFLEDEPRITLDLPRWLLPEELRAACALPRVYHLLKLCFVGGRLPRRPVEGDVARRTGDEPFPADSLDVLSLLEAERLESAVQLAARRLRAKGYPAVLRDADLAALPTRLDCRRLAAMMLIPVEQPGVSAALAIKPESTI